MRTFEIEGLKVNLISNEELDPYEVTDRFECYKVRDSEVKEIYSFPESDVLSCKDGTYRIYLTGYPYWKEDVVIVDSLSEVIDYLVKK